jgi:pyrroloquinoline quinone (PQQ) biosynthesis protein C
MSGFAASLEAELAPQRKRYDASIGALLQSGRFGPVYPAILVETYHYVKHSCALMERSAAALEPARAGLREYLLEHSDEERGHEAWLLDDLEALGYDRKAVEASVPLAETASLVGRQLYVIEYLHPAGLLGYVYVMESRPPSMRWLSFLRDEVGIPATALTFFERHGDADVRHRVELAEALDRFFTDSRARDAARTSALYAIDGVVGLFERLRSGDFLTLCPTTLPSQQEHAHV